jgi:hypothetical protein
MFNFSVAKNLTILEIQGVKLVRIHNISNAPFPTLFIGKAHFSHQLKFG